MKTTTIKSRVLVGLEARDVTVYARSEGWKHYDVKIVGLASEAAERESRLRVRSALDHLGVRPEGVLVAVEPPAPPGSTHLDLPIAVAVLAAMGEVPDEPDLPLFGELALDGRVRPVRGACLLATDGAVVPADNAREAALVAAVHPIDHLREALEWPLPFRNPTRFEPSPPPDAWGDLRTTPAVRRALEIAAAGGHSTLLVGPPGSGKTLIALALHSILPPLSRDEAVEVTKVHSVAGLVDGDVGYVATRPFRAPHHSVSVAGLTGGGSATFRPGEVSLAHRGVLFLDELPEFRAGALDNLRRALRHGEARLAWGDVEQRRVTSATFPARPQLVASVNPCPCGWRGIPDPYGSRACACSAERVKAYWDRMKPWLDLFAVRVDVAALTAAELTAEAGAFDDPRGRVAEAHTRRDGLPWIIQNTDDTAIQNVSRTIAALAGSIEVTDDHVREARELCGVRS